MITNQDRPYMDGSRGVMAVDWEEQTVIVGLGAAQGIITLQGRTNHSGVVVTAWQGDVEVASATTAPDGSYTLPLLAGTYRLTAEMERYLDAERIGVTVTAGGTLNVPAVELPGGDANDDDTINIQDLSLIGSHYGFECGDPGWDPRADINDDCVINIFDLTITGGNFGETSPVPW